LFDAGNKAVFAVGAGNPRECGKAADRSIQIVYGKVKVRQIQVWHADDVEPFEGGNPLGGSFNTGPQSTFAACRLRLKLLNSRQFTRGK
jgi:hypothetical protein